MHLATFPPAAAQIFAAAVVPGWKTPWKKSPAGRETPCLWRTEKPQNCTPKMPKVTSETHSSSSSRSSRSSSSSRSSRSRSMAVFSSCCCYAFWIPFLLLLHRFLLLLLLVPGWKHHGKNHLPAGNTCLWRTEKPQNCTPKMPNVTSETHSSSSRFPDGKHHGKITCRQGNTMPLKDGEAPKLHPENGLT